MVTDPGLPLKLDIIFFILTQALLGHAASFKIHWGTGLNERLVWAKSTKAASVTLPRAMSRTPTTASSLPDSLIQREQPCTGRRLWILLLSSQPCLVGQD